MSLRRDLRHGSRIARAEFVRSVRGYTRDTRRTAGLALALLFFGGNLLFALPTAYALGLTARSVDAIPLFGTAATVLPVAVLVVAVLRTFERASDVEASDLLLTTVHPRAVVVGLIGAEVARLSAWFGVPLAVLAGAFALGVGAPWLVATAAVVALPVVCWAAVWGYAVGILGLRLLRGLPGVRRVLKVGGLLALVGLVVASQFVGQYVAENEPSIGGLVEAIAAAPLVDYVALAFVGTPLARTPSVGALAVLVGLVALTPVGLAAATRQASVLWFTDATPRSGTRTATASSGGFAPPRPFSSTRAGRIGWAQLVRAVRHPQQFGHLLMVLFFVGPLGATAVQSAGDALGPLVAGTGVGLGTYLAGATFGLNPLGDDRPQLPLLLLSGTDPRTLVRGRVIAGLAIGVPVAVLVPIASVGLGASPTTAVALSAVGVGTCLAAGAFAVGVGAAYPVYEEREFWGTETVVPSTIVMMAYMFVAGGGTVIALIVAWFALGGAVGPSPAVLVAIGVYLAVTIGLPYGSYRYAIRRYRTHELD